MTYESDLMLSVQVHSKKDKQKLWEMLRRFGIKILEEESKDVTVILTANDEEDLLTSEAEFTKEEVSGIIDQVRTEVLDKMTPVIYKALLEQDAVTYHGRPGDANLLARETATAILEAMQ
jgi:hypothetical protein